MSKVGARRWRVRERAGYRHAVSCLGIGKVLRGGLRRCAGAVLRRGGIIADGFGCEQARGAFSCGQIRHFLLVVRMDGGLAIGRAYRHGLGRQAILVGQGARGGLTSCSLPPGGGGLGRGGS